MKIRSFIPYFSLFALIACGGSGGGGSDKQAQEEIETGEAVDGVYHAHLRPVNPRANGFLPHGGATFRVEGDKLSVKTYLDDDSSVVHRQSVHTGTSCPTAAHDVNKDGMVDYPEAMKAVGKVLVPLDGDISSQDAGTENYPKGSGFTYTKNASVTDMLNDLWAPDTTPDDEFTKLRRGQGMKLVGRVVLIHGTFSNDLLPATLAGRGSEPANLSLPVACGVIQPVP